MQYVVFDEADRLFGKSGYAHEDSGSVLIHFRNGFCGTTVSK